MFDASIIAAAAAHARAAYPHEAGGLVIGGAYVAFPNISPAPGEAFRLPDDAWPLDKPVEAVIHSHVAAPDPRHRCDPRAPSAADIEGQQATGVPWGILWTDKERTTEPIWFGDHLLDDPLFDGASNHVQRDFLHGVRDCFSILRCWFHQVRGVTLPDLPRDFEFWKTGGDLVGDNLAAMGFQRIARDELAPGDVALMRTVTDIDFPHHCGVLLEHGQLLHHPRNRLSCSEPLGRWGAFVMYGARRMASGGVIAPGNFGLVGE